MSFDGFIADIQKILALHDALDGKGGNQLPRTIIVAVALSVHSPNCFCGDRLLVDSTSSVLHQFFFSFALTHEPPWSKGVPSDCGGRSALPMTQATFGASLLMPAPPRGNHRWSAPGRASAVCAVVPIPCAARTHWRESLAPMERGFLGTCSVRSDARWVRAAGIVATAGFALLLSNPAGGAHGYGLPGRFVSGSDNPLSLNDHLLAIDFGGSLGAFWVGGALIYGRLPVSFPAMMVVGAIMGMFRGARCLRGGALELGNRVGVSVFYWVAASH